MASSNIKVTCITDEEVLNKHWEECRQIALYDDQLRKTMALLGRVKAVHAAAIRNGDAAVSSLTSRLLREIELLEAGVEGGTDGA